MKLAVIVCGVLLIACDRGRGDEALGDLAAADGRWSEAYDAWQQASDEPRVLAKRADAALNGGRLNAAAVEFTRLGTRDTSRRGEAAAGARPAQLTAQGHVRHHRLPEFRQPPVA